VINAQIDLVTPEDEDGEGTAVWSGLLPELPAGGDTLEIRREVPVPHSALLISTGLPERPTGLFLPKTAVAIRSA
jgi:hypothetical protein